MSKRTDAKAKGTTPTATKTRATTKRTVQRKVAVMSANPKTRPTNKQASKKAAPKVAAKQAPEAKIVKGLVKGTAVVDRFVPGSENYYVLPDVLGEHNGSAWSETMNNSEVTANNNKFYILQLIINEKTNIPSVFVRWGRVGYDGNNSLNLFNTIPQAKAFFLKKYNEKINKNYVPLKIDFGQDDSEKETEQNPSGLDKRVENLVKLIFDMKLMNAQMKEVGYDVNKTPLGKLGKETIDQAYSVLKRIEARLDNRSKEDLNQLSSDFYTLIPHNFGFSKMANFIIKDKNTLKDKMDLVQSLADIEIATKIIEKNKGSSNYIKDNYNKLNRDIKAIDKETDEYKMLEDFVNNGKQGWGNLGIKEAFKMDCGFENKRFKDFGGKKLLWHGSAITNYVGILSQGLRIAPPEAPCSGYNFGKGIYLADMCCKSVGYCRPRNNEALILLCETSLGTTRPLERPDFNAAKLPFGTHSTHGVGMHIPNPKGSRMVDGVEVPMGKPIKNPTRAYLGYNEFIVYDVAQVKLKYLIKLKC